MNTDRRLYASRTLIVVHMFAALSGFSADTPPLIEAIKSGDTTTLNTLLTSNPSLDARDEDGNTALHWAAIKVPDQETEEADNPAQATSATGVPKTIFFARDIQPVLKRSCIGCHSGRRAKRGLRVDTRDEPIKGGQSGEPAIVLGRPGESRWFNT